MKDRVKRPPKAYETLCGKCGGYINRKRDAYGWEPERGYLCVPCWKAENHPMKEA